MVLPKSMKMYQNSRRRRIRLDFVSITFDNAISERVVHHRIACADRSASEVLFAGMPYHAYLPSLGVEVRPVFELEPALLSLYHICDFELSQLMVTQMAFRRDG